MQDSLSDDEQVAFDDLMETVEEELEDCDNLRERVKSMLGILQKERYTDAVKRTLAEETEHEVEEFDDVSSIGRNRGSIVHQGEHVEDAVNKARTAQEYLHKLLDSRLSENIDELVDFDLPLEFEDIDGSVYRPEHPTVAPEDWLAEVFEYNRGKALTTDQILKRAYPIFRDIHKVAKIQILLPKLTGWDEPLRDLGDGEYEYAPMPDWVVPEIDAIIRYLNGAGEVPPSVIARNTNNIRNDIDIDAERAEQLCEELVERGIVEESEGYFALTLDGRCALMAELIP